MRITQVDVREFRKLKKCKIEISEKETVFVGANNSGKTSAMDALVGFLRTKKFTVEDFTICNWKGINSLIEKWLEDGDDEGLEDKISSFLPQLDLWIHVEQSEIYHIQHLLPTLQWAGGEVGINMIYAPKDLSELLKDYKEAYSRSRETEKKSENSSFKLWPLNFQDFLQKKLNSYFSVKSYKLDPKLKGKKQNLDDDLSLTEPLNGLIKIDIINAQRGFSDPHAGDGQANNEQRLSSQFRHYFEKHLNPEELPSGDDLDALSAMESARSEFDKRLRKSFESSIKELEKLSYPGFSDPNIHITSKIKPIDGLDHAAAVQFNLCKNDDSETEFELTLPEKYNGLGYQNLISMIFNLIRYRDDWMKVGKARAGREEHIEPLHLVLVEEPEAHLHAQVQQVFIRKAYDVLRDSEKLRDNNSIFSTQLMISTHSSHIAHEIDFCSLRYFKRDHVGSQEKIPFARVVNLSNIFGDEEDTGKFATRYLQTTHCDLFFADAVILVEGPAERMLVPHFIKGYYEKLHSGYVSLLEIGGSHAHRLRPLIDALAIPTLVITDLDSAVKEVTEKPKRTTYRSTCPNRGQGLYTNNSTLKKWVPGIDQLDPLLDAAKNSENVHDHVKVVYQYDIEVNFNGKKEVAIPYTFEDALVLANLEYFKELNKPKGLLKKMKDSLSNDSIKKVSDEMLEALGKSAKKAEMALELMWDKDPKELVTPKYISEGLEWLQSQILNEPKGVVAEHSEVTV